MNKTSITKTKIKERKILIGNVSSLLNDENFGMKVTDRIHLNRIFNEQGEPVKDYFWIKAGKVDKNSLELLQIGDRVQFEAFVEENKNGGVHKILNSLISSVINVKRLS